MNNLSCNVGSCLANKDGGCCRRSINVEGAAAGAATETICGSYQKKGSASALTGDQYANVNTKIDVCCSAAVCCYNDNGKCSSDTVCIDCNCGCGDRSECSTFRL